MSRISYTKCKDCGTPSVKTFCSYRCEKHWRYHNEPAFRELIKLRVKQYTAKIKDTPAFKKRKAKKFKEWLERNREKYNAYYRKYRAADPKKFRKYYHDYFMKNREKLLAIQKINYRRKVNGQRKLQKRSK